MTTTWYLKHDAEGFKKGTRWTLIKITPDGWYMELSHGVRRLWSDVNVFVTFRVS